LNFIIFYEDAIHIYYLVFINQSTFLIQDKKNVTQSGDNLKDFLYENVNYVSRIKNSIIS